MQWKGSQKVESAGKLSNQLMEFFMRVNIVKQLIGKISQIIQ